MTIGNLREIKGLAIANKSSQIKRVNDLTYKVHSQSRKVSYLISQFENGWTCECPDHKYRELRCKHIFAVEFSLASRKTVEKTKIEPIVNPQICQICGSEHIVKDGVRHNKSGNI